MRPSFVRHLAPVALAGALAGCGAAPAAAPTTAPPAASTAAPTTAVPTAAATAAPTTSSTASGYPVTVENCGRTLTFTKAPERVEATYQTVAEVLLKLGLGDKIIGVHYGRDLPPLLELATDDARLQYYGDVPPKEVALAAHADLVVAGYFFDLQDSGGKSLTQAEYEANGAQVYRMTAQCTNSALGATVEDAYTDFLNLGKIFGVEDRAQAIVKEMRDRIAAVQARVAGHKPVPALLVAGSTDGPISVFGAGLPSQLVALAGGENVYKDAKEVNLMIGLEELASKAADVFVISWYDGPAINPPRKPEERLAFLYKTFPNMPAAKQQRAVLIRGGDFQANLRIPDMVEQMAQAFHPEAFAK